MLDGCIVSARNATRSTSGTTSTLMFPEPTSTNGWFIELDENSAVPAHFQLEAADGAGAGAGWAVVGAPSRRFAGAAYFGLRWVFLPGEPFAYDQVPPFPRVTPRD